MHKFSPGGKLIMSWGSSGTEPGQFNIAHNIASDDDGWIYVADRENHRVQVFDGNGKYETQWNNLHRPCALCCCGGKQPSFIVGELGSGMPVNRQYRNIGPRLTIVDRKGRFTITEDWLESRCGWSPFTGMELEGRVIGTIVRGHTAMWEAEIASEATGEALKFAGAIG